MTPSEKGVLFAADMSEKDGGWSRVAQDAAASAELSRSLAHAEELLEQGNQRQALLALRVAGDLARGDDDAFAAVLSVATGWEGRLQGQSEADLIHDLHDDFAAPHVATSRHPERVTAGVLAAFLAAAAVGAALGLVLGGLIGNALYPAGPDEIVFGSGFAAGAEIGLVIGVVAGVLALRTRRRRLTRDDRDNTH